MIRSISALMLLSMVAGTPADKPVTDEDRAHWSFVPPKRVEPPEVGDRRWVRNPIDAFILAKLADNRRKPAPEADRPTLIRRLSFDLIGLPPTIAEVDAFVNDPSRDAYEKVVDRLLASPHHGERWAQHWLDLARYADSDGFEYDQARPDMWRYRDWVVNALNSDVPYDRFLKLQLAGDELAPEDPSAVVATGFNRLYPDMVDINDQNLRRQNALNDITETAGAAILGLTIGCARCHDHKYDPIRQSDFYSLQAFFATARFRDDLALVSPSEREARERAAKAWDVEVGRARAAIVRIEWPIRERLAPGLPPGLSDQAIAAFAKPDLERDAAEVQQVYNVLTADKRVDRGALDAAIEGPAREIRTGWKARLDALLKDPPAPPPKARGLDEDPQFSPRTYLLRRGELTLRGPEVTPAFPAVLATGPPRITPAGRSSGRRSALADWLTRPDHPLTARVMVNRLWQHHFGRGIVATPSDFGTMGEGPSHPELLDWLAAEFASRGWGLKGMHRLIVTSSTYRQGSRFVAPAFESDPDNTLLWRHSRTRLDGEAIRDALLSASGLLNPSLGGPCVFPELPAELTKLSSHGAVWPTSPRPEDRNRRSLYVFLRRNLRYPFFEAFDRPDTNASCPNRPVTTIAPQALSLLNGKLADDAAHALADRVSREAADRKSQIERAYRLTLGRMPSDAEAKLAAEFLRGAPLADFCLALMNTNEFVYID